jgi:A/G-specific adenine glycosylase
LTWYRGNARDLPWRRTRDPYLIWISEIMLQQTRVAAVLEHYARFTARFPSVEALAAASEADVLAMWSGLGYYRRARMMHRAAQVVVTELGGVFPRTAEALLELPGIGAYTAAAVASIAFDEPVAVVDGNVERVLARVAALDLSIDAKRVRGLAGALLDARHASHFNQGMMELGATVCLPRGPLCLHCPVQPVCRTRGEHAVVARKPLVPRDAFYALVEKDRRVLLEQRAQAESLMAGMWQLPELAAAPEGLEPLYRVKHSITMTNYSVRVFAVDDASAAWKFEGWERAWVSVAEVDGLPLTGLARKVLRKLR